MSEQGFEARQDGVLPIRHRRTDPVFVIGHGRSGTSILATLLRQHLRVAFGTESQFFIRYHRQLARYGDLSREANRRAVRAMASSSQSRIQPWLAAGSASQAATSPTNPGVEGIA